MFSFSACGCSVLVAGFVMWMDEIRFENLGISAQPLISIFGSENLAQTAYSNSVINVTGITHTVTLGDASVVTTSFARGYLDFKPSDLTVAQVNEWGEISVMSAVIATKTSKLKGVEAVV